MAPQKTLRLAHRGDWRAARENLLEALTAALANGACDGLEFDVRASSDHIPVLNHDATLARVHGRPERIDGMTAVALGKSLGLPVVAPLDESGIFVDGRGPLVRHRRNGGARLVPGDDGVLRIQYERSILG